MDEKFQINEQLHTEPTASVIQSNMLWNVIGSFGFIGAQWAMTILIVHLAGYSESGILSLGLSLTNVFTNVAYFCVRNFQVSDQNRYTADTYVTHRVIMTVIAILLYTGFVLVNGYDRYTTTFLILFMLYRVSEALVDVFHGIDQRAWRLDIAGRSFLIRGILTVLSFVVALKLTGNLVITTLVMLCLVYAVILLYDVPKARRLDCFSLRVRETLACENGRTVNTLLSLTRECMPLFLYAVCLNAIVPIPRYFLEKMMGSEILGFYASVAIPASVIQLLSSYVFTTFTKLFADHLAAGRKAAFLKLFRNLSVAIIALVALATAGSLLLGEWVLVLVFTEEIRPYTYLLAPTVLCCGLIAYIWFLGMLLTVMRDRMGLFIGAAAGAITAAIVSVPCIRTWGVDGVNMALFISNGTNFLVFVLRFIQKFKKATM
ncbi:MAG: hypothetical protein K5641_03610 [Lachnospiraceae bacterium]|nr:hypothetical protein [Lachnospiraceae bacterium]